MIPIATSDYKVYATEDETAAQMRSYIEELSYDVELDVDGYVYPVS